MKPGDRVAVMLEPSRAFYVAMFGAIKYGAIAVPLFTLFGPDGIRLRVQDCAPRMLITNAEKAPLAQGLGHVQVVVANDAIPRGSWPSTAISSRRRRAPTTLRSINTRRALRASCRKRSSTRIARIVTLMLAALYGTGLRPGDRFFCPSSPAWGHGLWHGTLAPLALGITIGAFSGKFNAERLLKALHDHRFTNLSAAATHYRMMRNSGAAANYTYFLQKLSFTGEPIDSETATFAEAVFGHPGLQHVRHD